MRGNFFLMTLVKIHIITSEKFGDLQIGQLLMEFNASQSVGHCVLVPKLQVVCDRRKSSEKLWLLGVYIMCCTSVCYFV